MNRSRGSDVEADGGSALVSRRLEGWPLVEAEFVGAGAVWLRVGGASLHRPRKVCFSAAAAVGGIGLAVEVA